MSNTSLILYEWLSPYLNVSKGYLENFLVSHPYYPSLHSVTSCIEHLGLKCVALSVDKAEFSNLPEPFLIHLNKGKGEFVLVTNSHEFQTENPVYIDQWDGVVVILDRESVPLHEGANINNSNQYKSERKSSRIMAGWCLGLFGFFLVALSFSFSIEILGLFFTSITGVFISILVVQHDLGMRNAFMDKFCGNSFKIDCDSVLKSNAAVVYGDVRLGDVGSVYFITNAIAIAYSVLMKTPQAILPLFTIMAILALPFTIFSVIYQWRIVKKWCTLCLIILALLWAQAALLTAPFRMSVDMLLGIELSQAAFYSFSILLVSGGWFLIIKPMMKREAADKVNLARLRSFQRNPVIFFDSLKKERRIDVTPFTYEIELGNAEADFRLVVASNLFCKPCSDFHKKLHDLLHVYGERMSLVVRFSFQDKTRDQDKDKAAEYMLSYLLESGNGNREDSTMCRREVLNNWFTWSNEAKFYKAYPCAGSTAVENLVQQHLKWTKNEHIKFTPSVFINGFELPPQYRSEELLDILPDIIAYNEELAGNANNTPN